MQCRNSADRQCASCEEDSDCNSGECIKKKCNQNYCVPAKWVHWYGNDYDQICTCWSDYESAPSSWRRECKQRFTGRKDCSECSSDSECASDQCVCNSDYALRRKCFCIPDRWVHWHGNEYDEICSHCWSGSAERPREWSDACGKFWL